MTANVKNAALAIVVAIAVGFGAYGLTLWLAPSHAADADEMAWLRREFRLTAAQAEKIGQLHAAYEPVCMEHCMQILATRKRMKGLADAGPNGATTRGRLAAGSNATPPRNGGRGHVAR